MASTKTEIEKLTSAEIGRQLRDYSQQRDAITAQLAEIYKNRKDGAAVEPDPVSDRVGKVRARALALLKGDAPPSLTTVPEMGREEKLYLERDSLDLIIKILQDKRTVARSAESVEWVERNVDAWRALCREHVLAAARLHHLETKAAAAVDRLEVGSVRLPFAEFVGRGLRVDYPNENLDNAIAAALRERIISRGDLEEVTKHAKS